MTKIKVRVEGLRDLEKRLSKLEKDATKKTIARNALKVGGKVISDTARRLAPFQYGGLRKGIDVGTRLSRSQRSRHIKRDPVEVFAGASATSSATQQEFGNVNHPAQPFMRPAFDSQKEWALAAIENEMEDNITRAIKRQAKARNRKKR